MMQLTLAFWLSNTAVAAEHTIGVVVGAFSEWNAECLERSPHGPPDCRNEGRRLRHAGEDAWRFAYLLQARLLPSDILTFTELEDDLLVGGRGSQMLTDHLRLAGGATMAEIREGVSARATEIRASEGDDTRISIILYISSHGSRAGFHLEDGIHSYMDFIEEIRIAADPSGTARIEAVLSDACDSASMSVKGSVIANTSARLVERAETVEVSVYDKTDEVSVLRGGVLSYVLRSALVGGADYDNNGELEAREMLDYLESYRGAFGSYYTPVVRARGSWDTIKLVDDRLAATLYVGEDVVHQPTRWLVTVPVGSASDERTVILADVFSEAVPVGGKALTLPPGEYEIWQLPYLAPGVDGGAFRADFVYDVREGRRLLGQRCRIVLTAGAEASFEDCFERTDTDVLLSMDSELVEEEQLRRVRGSVDDVIGTFPNALPLARPTPDYRLRVQNERLLDQAMTYSFASTVSSNLEPRSGMLVGGRVAATRVPRDGELLLRAGIDTQAEVLGEDASNAFVLSATAGVGRPLLTGAQLHVGGFLDGVVGMQGERSYLLSELPSTRSALMVGVDAGISASFSRRTWSVRGFGVGAEVLWSPRFSQAVVPAEYSWIVPKDVVLRPDLGRMSVRAAVTFTPTPKALGAHRKEMP